jgi:hypothetical protein
MDEGRTPPLGPEAEASVAEAGARLADVMALLEKWGRQPRLLEEVKALRDRLERLLATMAEHRPEAKDG